MLDARRLAALLFFLGVLTCTWDLLLAFDLGGFTLKIQQPLFFGALLSILWARRHEGWRVLARPFLQGFPLAMLALGSYYLLGSTRSFFPLKSFLYSGWLLFNLVTIWYTAQLLAASVAKETFARFAWVTLLLISAVILVDHVAHGFGHIGGIIGYNQDAQLKWGVSRPQAFSFEPSYIAAFLCFALLLSFAAFQPRGGRRHPWALASLLPSTLALFATTSRTGWFSFGGGFGLYFLLDAWAKRKIPWRQLGLIGALSIGGLGIFLLTTTTAQRQTLDRLLVSGMITGIDGSGNARLRAHLYAVDLAKETQWLGTGLGASFKYWISTRDVTADLLDGPFTPDRYGHEIIMSIWGQLLAEGGLPGVLLFLAAGFFLGRSLWRQWRRSREPLALGAFVSVVVFFGFTAFWVGNVARGDMWVWYALWGVMALPPTDAPPSSAA